MLQKLSLTLALLVNFPHPSSAGSATITSDNCSSLMYFTGLKIDGQDTNVTESASDVCVKEGSQRKFSVNVKKGGLESVETLEFVFEVGSGYYWFFWGEVLFFLKVTETKVAKRVLNFLRETGRKPQRNHLRNRRETCRETAEKPLRSPREAPENPPRNRWVTFFKSF